MKKSKDKTKKIVVPKETCKTVATMDIKYNFITLDKFLEWIKDNVPVNTKAEDITLHFDIDSTTGYYDEACIDANMNLVIKEKTK